MVEAGANEVSEEDMLQAILFGHEEIKRLIAFQERLPSRWVKRNWKLSYMRSIQKFIH